jgi:hypothetical protein
MTTPTFDKRFNAQRGARRALGDKGAVEGIDFTTAKDTTGRWSFSLIIHNAAGKPLAATKSERAPKLPSKAMVKAAADRAEARASQTAKDAPKPKKGPKVRVTHEERPSGPAIRMVGRNKAALEAAANGILPEPPDMSAPSHAPFLKALKRITALVERGALDELMADTMKPKSSSRVMICRYRDFCIQALKVQRADGRMMTEMTQAEWERRCISEAVEFTATKFLGRGNYETKRFKTLAQAGGGAHQLGDGAIIYAITPKGRQVMVGGIRKGTFEPTEAARELATSAAA